MQVFRDLKFRFGEHFFLSNCPRDELLEGLILDETNATAVTLLA